MAAATIVFALLVLYFIWQASRDQDLDLDYSIYYSPGETILETRLDVKSAAKQVWRTVTDLSSYPLWFPWVSRVRVTNKDARRWVHLHSFQHYRMEVGSRFQIRPFLFSPLTQCRFISIEPERTLSMEMRFFPFIRELVTFTMKPYAHGLELTYRSTHHHFLGFISAAMFSWKGKEVLRNLAFRTSQIPVTEAQEAPIPEQERIIIDDAFIKAIAARAMTDGVEILNKIPERPLRAKAKSFHMKASRSGEVPEVTAEAAAAVEQFLSTGVASETALPPAGGEKKEPAATQDDVINGLVARTLAGDEDAINSIEDRVLRSKAKAALIKAKRSADVPQAAPSPTAHQKPGGVDSSPEPPEPRQPAPSVSPVDPDTIQEAVKKALAGDMDAINAISDRVARAKAKSAYTKAKRQRQ
ncbi:MAG: SRPBCC family protein [Fidelibacterota bacterium]